MISSYGRDLRQIKGTVLGVVDLFAVPLPFYLVVFTYSNYGEIVEQQTFLVGVLAVKTF